jgi:hypothetical protein
MEKSIRPSSISCGRWIKSKQQPGAWLAELADPRTMRRCRNWYVEGIAVLTTAQIISGHLEHFGIVFIVQNGSNREIGTFA